MRMSSKCVLTLATAALMAGVLFAAPINEVKFSLPHAVSVGSTTLPVGAYTITSFEMGEEEVFIVRGEHTPAVTLISERVDSGSDKAADKTHVTLSKDGDIWHFEKLTVEGEASAYQFLNAK